MGMKKLTDKWLHFVAVFDGNIAKAAKSAELHPSYARRMINDPLIKEALQKRNTERSASGIASREERQQFWTKVANDPGVEMKDRLRASELLGKSERDFIERVEQSGPNGGPMQQEVQVTFIRPGDVVQKESIK